MFATSLGLFSWQLPIFAVATSQSQPAGLLRATASDLNVLQPELCLQPHRILSVGYTGVCLVWFGQSLASRDNQVLQLSD